ncbi:Rpn family recombination-promoting nuclease/putative transposase [Lachnospiraceae bacterium MD335]|nr:Rpn family recombination-promoting nuclease/putative transposase [Lachnospiraceae bacterium MD335]
MFGADNEIVRKHFISDVLNIPLADIKSVRIMNPFFWKRYKRRKQGILDIQLELNNDTKINIELQIKQQSHWEKRSIFYPAKMYTADLRRGEAYKKAKKCIAISILDFNIDERADYHNIYALRDKHGKLYSDVLELHTIELKKNPNKEKPCPLNEWHSLFNAKTEEDLNMLKSKTKNHGIMEAIKELREVSLTDRIRLEHEMRLKFKRDRRAEDEFVFEQGRKAGISQGMEKLIKALRKNNYTDEQIVTELMEAFDLSREEAQEKLQ